MSNYENEIWRPAVYIKRNGIKLDLTHIYLVSNYGRTKTFANQKTRKEKERHYSISRGYYCLNYSLNHKKSNLYVNRLVASTFPDICGEYFEGAVVNHKNENKTDNRAENLEWITQLDNVNYGTSLERRRNNLKIRSKTIVQYDLNGNVIREWKNSRQFIKEILSSKNFLGYNFEYK